MWNCNCNGCAALRKSRNALLEARKMLDDLIEWKKDEAIIMQIDDALESIRSYTGTHHDQ